MMRYALATVIVLTVLVGGSPVLAEVELPAGVDPKHPLEEADRSSPRATFRTFIEGVTAGWKIALETRARGVGRSSEQGRRAIRSLNLSQVPPAQQEDVGIETAILLLDVFNRIELPRLRAIPDAEAIERSEKTAWTVPHTPITIARVEEGPRSGEWLFTPETVRRAREFYRRTRHLPLEPDAVVEDGYRIYIAAPGSLISPAWITALPEWTQEVYYEQTAWQWLLLGPVIVLAALLGWAAIRLSQGPGGARASTRRRLLAPVSLVLLAGAAIYLIDQQLNLTGTVLTALQTLFNGITFLAAAWAAALLGRMAANWIAGLPRIRREPLNAELVRLAVRIVSFVVVFAIVGVWARSLGVPVVAVLTGLGVGGIAVALAAQSTIENFIGSLTLYADRPLNVGDFCVFGDKLGTVESIGFRSTRIRTLERSVLTIPNAEFSRLQLDNLSKRDRRLFRTTLSLRLETTTEQIERVIGRVRAILLEHDRVFDVPARVELTAVGPYSIDIEIFAYLRVTDQTEFLALRRELLLPILREVEEAGTALAAPGQTTYLRAEERPSPSDEDTRP